MQSPCPERNIRIAFHEAKLGEGPAPPSGLERASKKIRLASVANTIVHATINERPFLFAWQIAPKSKVVTVGDATSRAPLSHQNATQDR